MSTETIEAIVCWKYLLKFLLLKNTQRESHKLDMIIFDEVFVDKTFLQLEHVLNWFANDNGTLTKEFFSTFCHVVAGSKITLPLSIQRPRHLQIKQYLSKIL